MVVVVVVVVVENNEKDACSRVNISVYSCRTSKTFLNKIARNIYALALLRNGCDTIRDN